MTISVTADNVVFAIGNASSLLTPEMPEPQIYLLLIKRGNDPFKGQWALPGGFVEEDEALIDAAKRELLEETGLALTPEIQMTEYAAVGRDPRGRTISFPFAYIATEVLDVKGGDDAAEARWFDYSDVADLDLAFDHREIIEQAFKDLGSVAAEMYLSGAFGGSNAR